MKHGIASITLFALAALACACAGGGGGENAGAGAPAGEETATQIAENTTQSGAMTDGAQVALAGTLGCGHCTFETTKDCAAAVKVASGEIYLIDGIAEGSDLWNEREEPQDIKLTGKVSKSAEDGLMHVSMTSYEIVN